MKKIKILRIIPTLDPSYGGPSKATIDSSIELQKKNFDVDILTCDKKNGYFKNKKNIRVFNMGPSLLGTYWLSFKLFIWLKKNRKKYDIFIVHGIWQFISLSARLLLKNQYFIFLHGQLDPFFRLDFFKFIKKKIYWHLIEKQNLIHSNFVLLTSDGEKKNLYKTFVNLNGIKKKVVNYGLIKPLINPRKLKKIFYNSFRFLENKKFYLFLGRFHEKKGCEIIIKTIHKLNNKFNDKILLVGPIRNTLYENKLKKLIIKYNLENKIYFSDALYGDLKWAAIHESKAMILPSHGENFGVSLVESLSMSRPVITTNKVNICDTIASYNAGFISKDNTSDFSTKFQKFLKLNNNEIDSMKKNSLKCFNENFNLKNKKNSLESFLQSQYKITRKEN